MKKAHQIYLAILIVVCLLTFPNIKFSPLSSESKVITKMTSDKMLIVLSVRGRKFFITSSLGKKHRQEPGLKFDPEIYRQNRNSLFTSKKPENKGAEKAIH